MVIFILILIYIGYDFSTRTTFPGRNTNIEDDGTIEDENDTDVPADSIMILENT